MYKRTNNRDVCLVPISTGARAFDTFESQGYEMNECGFIRNDFSQLQERENTLGFYRALSAMQEYQEQHSNEGKTFEQIVAEIRPRWCQLNGEVDRFEQYCIDNALDFYKKLKDASDEKGKVANDYAEGAGVPVPSQPATVGNPT